MHHGYQDYSVISSVSTSLEGLLDNEVNVVLFCCFHRLSFGQRIKLLLLISLFSFREGFA